jgi:Beta-lactamase enzyme family
MRRLLAALLLTTALAAPASAQAAPARWSPDIAAARAWANHRAGTIAFAVRTDDHLWGVGLDRTFPSASVVKAMLLVAYLRREGVRHRDLTAADRALLNPMIRRSDNVAATRVFGIVGGAGLSRLARVVGMTRFAPASPIWGLSRISARDQTRFFLHIDARVPARHRAYAMELLRTIVPSQRWGIARAVPAGWTLWFKGGWGSGTGAVDHQIGLLRQGEDRVSIAVLTVANPNQRYGTDTEQGIAARLLHGLAGSLVGIASPAYAAGAPGTTSPDS